MNDSTVKSPSWLLKNWMPTFLAFPAGGLLARLIVGSADSTIRAIIGATAVGVVVGAVQHLSLRRFGVDMEWVLATAVGMAIATGVVSMTCGLGTDTGTLLTRGAIVGGLVALAQSTVQRLSTRGASLWILPNAASWAGGWFITSKVINDIEYQYSIFGSTGALFVTTVLVPFLPAVTGMKRNITRSAS